MSTRALRYHLLDVFTREPFGGNPLAVFPDAVGLDDDVMQTIARELNLSESIFLAPLKDGHVATRIFTPGMELPFAGHPSLGAAALLATLHEGTTRFVLDEEVGPIEVTVRRTGEGVFSELSVTIAPEFHDEVPADLHELLNLDAADIGDDVLHPRGASTGVPFLVVPLRSLDALRRARLNTALWEQRIAKTWAPHVYVVVRTSLEGYDAHVRMFAPAMNIPEDPATGGGATMLAACLADAAPQDGSWSWRILQGVEMGRRSELYASATKSGGVIGGIKVGGYSVIVGEGTLFY